jgi:hypothetical protein
MRRSVLYFASVVFALLLLTPAVAGASTSSTADQIAQLQKAVAALQTLTAHQGQQIQVLQTQVAEKHAMLNGSGAPAAKLGSVGDFYVNTATHQIYGPKTPSGWGSPTSLIGPKGATGATGATGPQGAKGATGATGASGPQGAKGDTGATGATGPQGLKGDTGATGASGLQGLKGDTGATGATGPQGAKGDIGATWYAGLTVPLDSLGSDGDFYLNNATADVYQKTNGSWVSEANLTGPQGAKGDTGATGAQGASGATWTAASGVPNDNYGSDGDFWLNNDTCDVYQRVSGSWVLEANLTGPQGAKGDTGATGAQGASGATWTAASGVPNDAWGSDGDFWLDNLTGDVYERESGTWAPVANLTGPQGAKGDTGAQGAKGATWTAASGVPNDNWGSDGDFWLNNDTCDVYQRVSGSWVLVTNLTGMQGSKGATGAQGPKGDTGAMGATGPQGAKGDTGATGATGLQGLKGDTGATGATGLQGLKGDAGATGATGAQGPKGDTGAQGATGATGPAGPDPSQNPAYAGLFALAPYVSVQGAMSGVNAPNIVFQGANVNVRSSGSEGDTNGTGNLIVGWDDEPGSIAMHRGGSNNLVCGDESNFPAVGCFVAGSENSVTGDFSSVSGGALNTASGRQSSVSGGSSVTEQTDVTWAAGLLHSP